MGIFAGITEAESSKGGSYIKGGVYDAEILKVDADKNRKGEPFFVVSFKILTASGANANAVDTEPSWIVMQRWDTFLGMVKHFCAVACDIDEADVTEEGVEAVLGAEQPLAGTNIHIVADEIETRSGGTFTKVRFSKYRSVKN